MRPAFPLVAALCLAAAALAAGCGKDSPPVGAPAPERPMEAPVAAESAPDPVPAAAPAAAPSAAWTPRPDLAVVALADGGFATLDVASGERGRLAGPVVSWCRTDPRAGVVWALTAAAEGADDVALIYVDLAAPGPPVTVATLPPGVGEVAVIYPDEDIGLPEPHRYTVLPALVLDDTPRVESRLGCDGDMAWRCYEDEADDAAGDTPATLIEELRELRFVIDEVRLAEGTHVEALVARAAKGPALTSPGELSARPTVEVPVERCAADPELCGISRPIPSTSWLEVVVGNQRDDFYYEARQLYDPVARRFLDATDPKRASASPLDDHEAGALEFNARGAWLTADAVVTREGGAVLRGAMTCGWAGPATRLGD